MMPLISSLNPGSTNPRLRPDAAQATSSASNTATDQPRWAISRATVRPARPAPTTHTSTSRSRFSRGRLGRATLFASYQPASMLLSLRPFVATLSFSKDDIHSTIMRRLLLFRHAKAERSQPGMEDRARKLEERGRRDAAKIGAYMASHALIPDQVMTSPSARTQETWKFAATAFRTPPNVSAIERLYDASAHTILAVIKGAAPTAHTLLIVGHN